MPASQAASAGREPGCQTPGSRRRTQGTSQRARARRHARQSCGQHKRLWHAGVGASPSGTQDYSGPTHEPAVFFFNKKISPRHKWKRIPRNGAPAADTGTRGHAERGARHAGDAGQTEGPARATRAMLAQPGARLPPCLRSGGSRARLLCPGRAGLHTSSPSQRSTGGGHASPLSTGGDCVSLSQCVRV